MNPAKKKVIILSIYFIIHTTSYSSFQTIITKVHEEQGDGFLGPFSFFISSSFICFSNLFTGKPFISQKWLILFGTIGYTLNYCTGIFMVGAPTSVKYMLTIFGNIIYGISSAFVWTAAGRYIHNVCCLHNELPKKGYYFGLFSTLYTISTVLGAVIVTFGFDLLPHRQYFMVVTGVDVLACLFCFFFVADVKNAQVQNLPTLKEQAIKTLKYYPKMKYALGYIFIDGISVAVSVITLLHLYRSSGDQHTDELKAGLVLLAFGFGCMLGGYLGGRLCDYLAVKKTAYIGMFIFLITCLLSILVSLIDVFPFSCFVAFLWGYLIYYVQANEMVLCSKLFKGKTQSFAVVKQFHCISMILYESISMLTHNEIEIKYLMSGLIVIWFFSFLLLRKLKEEEELLTPVNEEDVQINKDESCQN